MFKAESEDGRESAFGTLLCATAVAVAAAARVECPDEFAPAEGWVKPQEEPFRSGVCLNGIWQFQPVPVPTGVHCGTGEPPDLPLPKIQAWEATPIRIPSPWNVNTWGGGRDVGPGTARPYWPDSVYFPSYPVAWDDVEMGWLRRTFRVPANWTGRRIALHFEAVAGDCKVLVNGRVAGTHFDKYLPFELDVTELVRRDGENELLVGVRAHSLFDRRSERYPKMRAPYPCGSSTERLAGLWQDVFLLGLPPVRVEDVFVRPRVDADALEMDVTVRNDGAAPVTLDIGAEVCPWVNLAGHDVRDVADPKGRLDAPVLTLEPVRIAVGAGATTNLALRERINGRLKPWSPGSPNLHAALVGVRQGGQTIDRRFERFGWRQFSLRGRELLLNGQPIRLTGDLLHPFGPFTMSRRYTWAWYRMIRDFGGNAVRPHAQIHPRHYLDLADEMGLVVLDETAIFGSSIALDFEDPAAWRRFEEHYDGLVLRDRNHPSVLGWSFGNELFAIFEHNNVPGDVADGWYRRLADLGARARRLDPTRDWISCDGDEDLRGALPVWSRHFGHGTPLDRLPDIDKPLMVGESGGTYYARPAQLAEFNGARAFENYVGRNEALAIDVYDNIVRMARPKLAYYSASETAWFGVAHLGFGWRDTSRLPGRNDGVFFTRPFEEGKPGLQPERLPPFVATLNPGWDPALPLYQPLAMFHAQNAALNPEAPQPCAWDRRRAPAALPDAPPAPSIDGAAFVGDREGPLGRRLTALGVPLTGGRSRLTVVDAGALKPADMGDAKRALDTVRDEGGTVWVMLGEGTPAEGLLPGEVGLTKREATALVPDAAHPWTAAFSLQDLYFAEDGADRHILKRGIEGPLIEGARVLLRASDTDWSLFNDAPEHAKCAAVVLYEQLAKPSGAALVERMHGRGRWVLCSIDWRVATRPANMFWRRLFSNAGLRLESPADTGLPAFDEQGTLIRALAIGRFSSTNLDEALATDFVGEKTVRPVTGARSGGLEWKAAISPSRDRFVAHQMGQSGPTSGPFALYFSYWIRSPRSLDDLLAGGPDVPRFTTFCYGSERCRLFLNGRELAPALTEPADYRTRYTFENIPLKKDWNHFLVKVAARHLEGEAPATLAVRIQSSDPAYLRQIDTAVERK